MTFQTTSMSNSKRTKRRKPTGPSKLLVIDLLNVLYWKYYSCDQDEHLTLQQTMREIMDLTARFTPTHVIVCIDSFEQYWRCALLPSYKSQEGRNKPDASTISNLVEELRGALEQFGVTCWQVTGYEADDLIKGAVRISEPDADDTVVIISSDKDILQLLRAKWVTVLDPARDRMHTEESYIRMWGFHPRRLPEFLALAGDKSDHVPGVTGIGPSTAAKAIKSYESLDDLKDSPDCLSDAQARNLHATDLGMMLELCRLRAPKKLPDKEKLKFSGWKLDSLSADRMRKFGFSPAKRFLRSRYRNDRARRSQKS
jgi:protein Xni